MLHLAHRDVTMEITFSTNDLVTVTEAANVLGCARLTIYRWVQSGKILGVHVAGMLFIPKTEVERMQGRSPCDSRKAS